MSEKKVEDMNRYVTGTVIRELREKNKMTQLQLAEVIGVSDKTISKWETGNTVINANVSVNMMRSKFYICPICGNVLTSIGEAVVNCHGIQLFPATGEESDEHHMIFVEGIEDEFYVRIEHEMTKKHYDCLNMILLKV